MADEQLPEATPNKVKDRIFPCVRRARTRLQELGFRTYRVFIRTRCWSGMEAFDGDIIQDDWFELTPSPRVQSISKYLVQTSGGTLQDGSVQLTKIDRDLRKEQLIGRTEFDEDLSEDDNVRFDYVLLPLDQVRGESYNPASDAVLRSFEWRIALNPLNERVEIPEEVRNPPAP